MGLRLPDDWLWDFWLARDGADHHLFYLKAARSLGDPDRRHWHVSVGHAVSADLRSWVVLPDALAPGPAGAWDDYTTWTGSVLRDGDGWVMLYTGTARAEGGLVQRIGRAVSSDLRSWERRPAGPLIEADGRTYEKLASGGWHEEAWRDPYLFRDPDDGTPHALVTARAARGNPATRGVIGMARATGRDAWEVLPPVTRPGPYGHMEIPQLLPLPDGRWYLLYSVPGHASTADAPATALAGTHFLSAPGPYGPFEWDTHGVLLADPAGTWYGAKLVVDEAGRLVCLAWRHRDEAGRFVGELSDPLPVELTPDGPRARPE